MTMMKALGILCALGTALVPCVTKAGSANVPMTVGVTTSCTSQHVDAAVVFAAPADMPQIAHEMGFRGTTYVEVD